MRDFIALGQGPLYDTLLKNHHPGFQRLDVRGDGLDYDAALLSQMDWSITRSSGLRLGMSCQRSRPREMMGIADAGWAAFSRRLCDTPTVNNTYHLSCSSKELKSHLW